MPSITDPAFITPSGRHHEKTALLVLRPEESASLIGQAVATLPRVRQKTQQGRMVIVGGTTTRHVVRHLLAEDPGATSFAVGWIHNGTLGETPAQGRGPGPYLFVDGQITRGWPMSILEHFKSGDIYIKGANAIDPAGNAAILIASPTGGTIGAALTILFARGGELLIPVSLRKLIPSVPNSLGLVGQGKVDRVMGSPVGLMPILAGGATLITEIQALAILYALQATPIASGGVEDCSGAVVLHVGGAAQQIDAVWDAIMAMRA